MLQELKVDLAALQERLRAANDLKEEMDASTETYNTLRKDIEAIDARTAELSESLEKLRAVADEVCSFVFVYLFRFILLEARGLCSNSPESGEKTALGGGVCFLF